MIEKKRLFQLGGPFVLLTALAFLVVPLSSGQVLCNAVCSGFDPPMHNSPVTVKGDRALPLKAVLLCDSVALTDLDLTAAPVVQVIFYPEGGGSPVDVTDDAFPVGQGTAGNQFGFSDSRWRYNLKTTDLTAEGTYQILMDTGDLSEYDIDPTCTVDFIRK